MLKRAISLLLSIAMVLSMVPSQVLAAENDPQNKVLETVEVVAGEETTHVTEEAEAPVEETTDAEEMGTSAQETNAAEEPEEPTEENVIQETEDVVLNGPEMSGSCGFDLTWELDWSGTLTISGSGMMDEFESETAHWYENADLIETVILDDWV